MKELNTRANLRKAALVLAMVFLVLSTLVTSIQSISIVGPQSFASSTSAQIMSIGSASGSLPVQVRRGSVIKVTVYVKNTAGEARTFYVGASIIGEGEITWKDLPGWGLTPVVNPDEIYAFTFGEYTIPSNAYMGYHGIVAKVWADSSKTSLFAERWFPQVVLVGERPKAYIALSFDFESDDESYKSSGYVNNSTLNAMKDILDLLSQNEIATTIFVQGACLENSQSGSEFRNVVSLAVAKGFEIASHSYSHPLDINSFSESDIEREIITTENLLKDLTGTAPVGFRAPYFAYGERLWNVLAKKGYIYDSSVWQYEPVIYSIETPSGRLIEVPWKHQDGDTSYSDLTQSINYAANYGKLRVIDFHPQNVKEHWAEFRQFIGLVSSLKSEGKIEVFSISQLAQASPRPWEDEDRDGTPNYLDKAEFSVSTLKSSLNLFGFEWSAAVYVITAAIDRSKMISALQQEGVEDLSPYANIVPVVIDVKFPFPDVDGLLEWLASCGIINYGDAYRFKSQIESLFSSDGHLRIAIILKWNSVNDWEIDFYLIRDRSPLIWKLWLITFIVEYAPAIVSVAAYAYQLLVKGVSINPLDVLTEAVSMVVVFTVMQLPYVGPFTIGILWAVSTTQSVGQLLEAIRDPRLDLHLFDSNGQRVLGMDYESGSSITTSQYGIYSGVSNLNQYIVSTKLETPYTINVVSRSPDEIEYYLYGIDFTANYTIYSSGRLAPNESTKGWVYLYQNAIRVTQLLMSTTLSKSSIFRNEDAVLTVHVSNENGTSVSDANVGVQTNNTFWSVVNKGDGFYESTIRGSMLVSGNYTIKILTSKVGMLKDMKSLTLTVRETPTQIPLSYEVLVSLAIVVATVMFVTYAIAWKRRKRKL